MLYRSITNTGTMAIQLAHLNLRLSHLASFDGVPASRKATAVWKSPNATYLTRVV